MTDDVRRHAKAAALLALHHASEPLVLPNVWDGGSARIAEGVGFPALATTSAGIAFSHGVPDGTLGREPILERVAQIVAATGLPVTADIESGYGPTPDDVSETVARAASAGAVGVNLEDADASGLMGAPRATERIRAARQTAPAGTMVINARTDVYLAGAADPFDETVRRAVAFLDAGADCVFVPGVGDAETIGRLVAEIPGPLNVVAGLTSSMPTVEELGRLGVARVSVGGSLARAVLAYAERALRALYAYGDMAFTDTALAHADLQHRFARPV
ncbi:isocitrate lyase/PEP mutase family protein [Mumia sp. Pv 4-285]|uniref:isocitrate lyase/PEP mutase family protein n=1 Tax=Mumia qirimensis TaxID=3234852 RepID=UPI00351CDEEF